MNARTGHTAAPGNGMPVGPLITSHTFARPLGLVRVCQLASTEIISVTLPADYCQTNTTESTILQLYYYWLFLDGLAHEGHGYFVYFS